MRQRPVFPSHSSTVQIHPLQRQLRLRAQAPSSVAPHQRQAFFANQHNNHHEDLHEPIYVAQNPCFRLPPHLPTNYKLKPGMCTTFDGKQEMIGFLLKNEMRTHVPIHELEALDCEELLAHYLKESQKEKGRLMLLSVEKGTVLEGRYPTFGLHLLTYLCRQDQYKILKPISIEQELADAVAMRKKLTATQFKC